MGKIILHGSTPSKKNSRINTRSGRSFPSAKYTSWHKDASLQLPRDIKIPSGGLITITFVAGDNRKFDLSNKAESVLDMLVDNGVLEDDNYSVVSQLHLHFGGVEKNNAHCIIEY